jgi:hypothetical protein
LPKLSPDPFQNFTGAFHPRRERPWINEGWNTVRFDAVAAGLAYLARVEEMTNATPPS